MPTLGVCKVSAEKEGIEVLVGSSRLNARGPLLPHFYSTCHCLDHTCVYPAPALLYPFLLPIPQA